MNGQTESVDEYGNVINLDKYWSEKTMSTTLSMADRKERLPIGSKIYVLDADLYGILTRITKKGICWVKVATRGGNHHHPVKDKTFRFPIELVVPDVRNVIAIMNKQPQHSLPEQPSERAAAWDAKERIRLMEDYERISNHADKLAAVLENCKRHIPWDCKEATQIVIALKQYQNAKGGQVQ